jgi:hypothetical protein
MTVTDPAALKAPKRQRLVSVTSLIDSILPKPGLLHWSEAQTAEGMLTLLRAGELHPSLTAAEALAAMREAKIGAEGVSTTAARRGVDVHALLERYARDGTWADPVGLLDVDDYPYAHALNDWLRKYRPEPLEIEQLVADPEHGYAGRLDLIATIDGQRTLVDLKTSEKAAIWDAAHLQTRAYSNASLVCGDDPCDRILIVVVAKDGTWREMDCLMTQRGLEDALRYHRALKPVTAACTQANKVAKDERTEPAAEKLPKVKVERVEDDPSTHPGAMQRTLRRELPTGGLIEYVESPRGWTTLDATRRRADFRAYYFTPPAQEPLRAAA